MFWAFLKGHAISLLLAGAVIAYFLYSQDQIASQAERLGTLRADLETQHQTITGLRNDISRTNAAMEKYKADLSFVNGKTNTLLTQVTGLKKQLTVIGSSNPEESTRLINEQITSILTEIENASAGVWK